MSSGRSFFGSNTVEFMPAICRFLACRASHLLNRTGTCGLDAAHALAPETLTLERTLSDLVNQDYALTQAETALMWQTAAGYPQLACPAHRRCRDDNTGSQSDARSNGLKLIGARHTRHTGLASRT